MMNPSTYKFPLFNSPSMFSLFHFSLSLSFLPLTQKKRNDKNRIINLLTTATHKIKDWKKRTLCYHNNSLLHYTVKHTNMGLVIPEEELSLDLRPSFVPKTITDFLCHLSTTPNASHKVSLLDDFVHRLQLELAKIQAFKRELPLCMFLLNDGWFFS